MELSPQYNTALLLAQNKQNPPPAVHVVCPLCVHHVTFHLYQEKNGQCPRAPFDLTDIYL